MTATAKARVSDFRYLLSAAARGDRRLDSGQLRRLGVPRDVIKDFASQVVSVTAVNEGAFIEQWAKTFAEKAGEPVGIGAAGVAEARKRFGADVVERNQAQRLQR